MKATFDLEPDLYRSIKVEAARADRSVRDVVAEALQAWLDAAEEREDRESADAALTEYRQSGGESAVSWFQRMAAEARATYAPDGE